jgi:hypothetical protein
MVNITELREKKKGMLINLQKKFKGLRSQRNPRFMSQALYSTKIVTKASRNTKPTLKNVNNTQEYSNTSTTLVNSSSMKSGLTIDN